jgi:hypothetical protein
MRLLAVGCLFLSVVCLLTSCKADDEYSKHPCRFLYDNMIHNDATLASAMDAHSRGVFCMISENTRAGVRYLVFENSAGMTSQQVETAQEVEAKFILGLNNGIIVGFQTLNTDGGSGGFVAYDVQCPNCVNRGHNTVNPSYRITMENSGIATCGKCGKKYDMNNGGIVLNGEEGDSGLDKYVASTTGPFGVVSVVRR